MSRLGLPVGTAAEVRARDAEMISRLGVPGVALMETAARGLAERVRARWTGGLVVVVAGPGHNGGDGWAAARWLHGWGVPVAVWSVGPSGGDAGVHRGAARAAGVREVEALSGASLVVDAVFGTGLSRPVEGVHADVLVAIQAAGVPVVACDLPSGLHADTGAMLGPVPTAVETVTFGMHKRGLLAGVGPELAGQVTVVDIGLGAVGLDVGAELLEPARLAARWPSRELAGHKTRSGHLLVVAGSAAMAGAAALTCRGALAAGAGLVTLAAPRGAWARLSGLLPAEVMVVASGAGDVSDAVPPAARYTAVAAGPGLGGGLPLASGLRDSLAALWAETSIPAMFDADALVVASSRGGGPRVLTPHAGEAGRLLGCASAEVDADRFAAARRLSAFGVALLKGKHTLIDDGTNPVLVNPTGGPVLATGGTGDVLTGIVGALLARGVDARSAAALAAWVHGHAADRLAAVRADGWTAGDVASEVPAAIAALRTAPERLASAGARFEVGP